MTTSDSRPRRTRLTTYLEQQVQVTRRDGKVVWMPIDVRNTDRIIKSVEDIRDTIKDLEKHYVRTR